MSSTKSFDMRVRSLLYAVDVVNVVLAAVSRGEDSIPFVGAPHSVFLARGPLPSIERVALTRDAAELAGVNYVMDVDAEEVDKILG